MKKITFILVLIAISTQLFSTNWLGWGYRGFNSSGVPINWSQESMVGTSNWITSGGIYTPHEGSGNIYFSTLTSSIGDETMLITEAFANDGVSNSLFTFWHMQKDFGGDNNVLEVYYRTSVSSSWVLLEAFNDAIEDWTEELILLPEQSATIQLGFKGIIKGGVGMQPEGVALDIVSIMYLDNTCSFPININTGATNSTSAQITWEESGSANTWDLEYGDYGYTQGTGTSINGINTTPEHTITGLTAGNQYDVYVRADCSGSYSEWIGPLSFYSVCNVISAFPYEETFDNSNYDDDDWNIGFTVNCWFEENGTIAEPTIFTGMDADWRPGEYGVNGDYLPSTSNSALARLGFGSSWLISPTFDLSTSQNYQLEFDIAMSHWANAESTTLLVNDTIAVVISTDGGATWNKTDILKVWDANTNQSEITLAGIHNVVSLGAYTDEVKIAFYVSGSGSGSSGHVFIDNAKITTFATTPILEVLEPTIWNAGPQLINGTDTSGMIFSIRNSGIGTLNINSITDLSATEFTTNFNSSITLDSAEIHTFYFEYTPTDIVNDSLYFVVSTDYGIDSILLKGVAYELGTCEIEIGTDVLEENLPSNLFYNNSFSQSIFLQSEINRDNQEFKKIYFYYNGYDQFTNEREFTIYMKHTSLTELTGWEDITTFDSLTTVTIDLVTEGWFEINLGTSFEYNNTDNIIIGVNTSLTSGMTVSGQEMYSHNAPNGDLMSIITYGSSQMDLENLPAISPIAFRPNVRFCLENTTGVVNVSNKKNTFSIYPNPASTYVQIESEKLQGENLQVLDITGKVLKQVSINKFNKLTIDISDLQNGIYFIKVGADVKKFIKK